MGKFSKAKPKLNNFQGKLKNFKETCCPGLAVLATWVLLLDIVQQLGELCESANKVQSYCPGGIGVSTRYQHSRVQLKVGSKSEVWL